MVLILTRILSIMFLVAHSWFSFHYGILSPEHLLQEATARGHHMICLTDINCSAGHADLLRLAKEHNVHALVGIEFHSKGRWLYTGVARNEEGLHQINSLLTDHLLDGIPLPDRAPEMPDAIVVYPLMDKGFPAKPHHNEYIAVRPWEVDKMRFMHDLQSDRVVAWPSATFRNKQDHNVHRLLQAIDRNTLLSMVLPDTIAPQAECFRSFGQVIKDYAHVPAILERMVKLLEPCGVDLEFDTNKNRSLFTGDRDDDIRLLRHSAQKGMERRYPRLSTTLSERFEYELSIIEQKDFVSYFLINWDLVNYAKEKGYFYVGRGSGANSLVAYCLGITDVDPIELDLYFERFINPARNKPPDFDIDFSWKDRDTVTRRLFERYGERHVALLATYNCFRDRAVVHELGKVFGLPPEEIEILKTGHGKFHGDDRVAKTIRRYGARMIDIPEHLGVHVGGVLISEKPLTYYNALHLPPKGLATTQFSMHEAEDLGLYKFDILSQRGLGHIRETIEVVQEASGKRIDIHNIQHFKQDPAIKRMLREGNTVGCFYVESPAMRMLLKKLKADDYLGLVAASSIIRPGVSQSGMMREYILRHHDPERRKQAPAELLRIMPETYGVMVYQEDVLKVSRDYAGLSLTQGDILRRGMAGKFRTRKEFAEVEEAFQQGALALGHPPEEVAEIWRQVVSFGGFSFAKGHSASYAVESYQSLYLKAHYPIAFMVGVANNFGGFYHTEFYLHEAKRAGAVVEAPCVNQSRLLCSLHPMEDGPGIIFLGLGNIKGLEAATAQHILLERERGGPYHGLPDLLERVPIDTEQARLLVRAGALRFSQRIKPQLLWDLTLLHRGKKSTHREPDLFVPKVKEPRLPELHHLPLADAFDEMELLGFPLSDPFELVTDLPKDVVAANDLRAHMGRTVRMLGYVVHVKNTRTHSGSNMSFGSFIDPNGDFWDSTQFPSVAARFPFFGRGVYVLTGRVEEEFGHCSLQAHRVEKLPWKADPRYGGN